MKLIIAMVQPEKLPDVKKALFDAQVHKMTVTNVVGAGQQKGYTESYRGAIEDVNLLKKVRVEIAVNDNFVQHFISVQVSEVRFL
jgi:nitrogen regulatory protein P-II 1